MGPTRQPHVGGKLQGKGKPDEDGTKTAFAAGNCWWFEWNLHAANGDVYFIEECSWWAERSEVGIRNSIGLDLQVVETCPNKELNMNMHWLLYILSWLHVDVPWEAKCWRRIWESAHMTPQIISPCNEKTMKSMCCSLLFLLHDSCQLILQL